MTGEIGIWSVLYRTLRFFNVCAVYYAIQLGRCVMFSFPVLGLVLFLRRTAFKSAVFLKGALWCLLVPVLFIGKLRFFYESRIGLRGFLWWNTLCMRQPWICWLYLAVMLAASWRIFAKNGRLGRMVAKMETAMLAGAWIYVNDLPVTPFTTGLLRPKIVLPRLFLEQYGADELELVVRHEQIHIRSGHLAALFLWDVVRVLLWPNGFLTLCTGYLQEDLEEMCDKSTIRQSRTRADGYGSLLLKSILLLQDGAPAAFSTPAAFVGDRTYQRIKVRIEKILRYRPYKRPCAWALGLATALATAGLVGQVERISYARCNPMEGVTLWDLDTVEGIVEDDTLLEGVVCYDDRYVYVDTAALREVVDLEACADHEVIFVFGGFYKMPGIGGCCNGAYINVSELNGDGVCKIPYESPFDVWAWIFERI